MDLTTSLIGFAVILICVVPIIVINQNTKKYAKLLLTKMEELAEKHQSTITRHDQWNNAAIGMDEKTGHVFFIAKEKNNENLQCINLSDVIECRVLQVARSNGANRLIEKLSLGFVFTDKYKSEVALEFYNSSTGSMTLSGELQLVEKWCTVINRHLAVFAQQKK